MTKVHQTYVDAASLFLRVTGGLLLCLQHGVQKYSMLVGDPSGFPDPIGIGHVPSILCSMGAECGAAGLVVVGLLTRLACIPVLFTMGMVALVVHHNDPWSKTEPSVLFFLIFMAILLLGPGRYSLDAWRRR
jgi:putative oxidoreductase